MDDRLIDIGPWVDIAHTEQDGVLVTSVAGEVDHNSIEVISAELTARLDQRPVGLVVDLEGVEFFGSLGVTAMLEACGRATRLGVGFAVAAGRRPVLRTLQVTGTVEVLRVRPTLQEALDLARSAA
ncbi:anti-sigma factor antagonist [Saccharothrix sp. ALI-22-I]|uniref:anti-sigma factor antagonist n=1 Tax=Saccharothrix sp. ALI-22-I TaxID=1933778 RepID=UPI0015C2CB02|nr:anti-sigma factor antagonist [Saccharothrix sp. ALI-22-I]